MAIVAEVLPISLAKVQLRFEVNIPELPDKIDMSTFMTTLATVLLASKMVK